MTAEILTPIARICLDLESRNTTDTLKQRIEQAAAIFCFPYYYLKVYGLPQTVDESENLALTNIPAEFQQLYNAPHLPVLQVHLERSSTAGAPFRWATETRQESHRDCCGKLADIGASHGITASFTSLSGATGRAVFSGPAPTPEEHWPRTSAALSLLCSASTRAYLSILTDGQREAPPGGIELSGDERQCLELTAQGLTAKKVGEQLSIPERTVIYHLKRVAERLKVKTTREALAEALHLGLIRKRHFGPPRFKGSTSS